MKTSDRIAKICEYSKIESYLEIGVESGLTFNEVKIPRKVAVDPKFMFDHKAIQTEKISFFEMSSDEYFVGHSNGELFDLIFIDGLHTYDQTLRDFNCALQLSKPSTIIIIDDVFPVDIYSSLRDRIKAVNYRNEVRSGPLDFSWHGDVFKTIFVIHDFYPLLSYITIEPKYGNSQTIVFRRSQEKFQTKFSSLEQIERLTYFDFRESEYLLNLRSEDEALNIVCDYLKGK